MKCPYLENLSTTVRTTDLPPTLGNPSTKSIAMSLQTSDGTGRAGQLGEGVLFYYADRPSSHG
ncbi:LOW QUALITY PROTEIN: hypothetical protein U9M48_043256 [Paspalum notatum var. saurae]|uniref:Uncharacterized protein n=1 Tax=Paspalum notatum var. saurae TaxID=547442 RepID=A0AAQ3UX39_PASNO